MSSLEDPMCRLCLEKSIDLTTLFDSNLDLLSTLEEFTGLKIANEPDMPSHICNNCISTIKTLINFKNMCLVTEQILREQNNEKVAIFVSEELPEEPQAEADKSNVDPQQIPNNNSKERNTRSKSQANKQGTRQKKQKERKDVLHSCYICGKLYNKCRMRYHLNQHFDKRPYVCETDNCGKSFPSPSQLMSHYKNCHTDIYSFQCDVCGKPFKVKTTYDIHRSYHFEPKIPCSICGKLLRHPRAVKIHMMSHTGERPFQCDVCQKSFQNRYTLKVHQRVHTKEKPFACTLCDKSFGYNCLLKSHTERCHPDIIVDER